MDTTTDEKESIVKRLTPSKRTLRVGAVLFLVVLLTGGAAAQTILTFYDDFEGTDVGETPAGWSSGLVEKESYNQFKSLHLDNDTANTHYPSVWNDGATFNPREENVITGVMKVTSTGTGTPSAGPEIDDGTNFTLLRIAPDNGDDDVGITLASSIGGVTDEQSEIISIVDPEGEWFRFEMITNQSHVSVKVWKAGTTKPSSPTATVNHPGSDSFEASLKMSEGTTESSTWIDWIGSTGADARLSGTVFDENSEIIEGVTITANQSGSTVNTGTSGPNGDYQIGLDNGTYNVTAEKPGYFNRTVEVNVSGDTTQDFTLVNRSQGLNLKVRPFVEHGQTVPYEVTASITNETTGEEERSDVTDDAVVTSSNPGVVSVNGFNNEITGTSDTSVNQRITLTAEYDHPDLEKTITDTQNVTVANATVNNLKILPPMTKWTATIGGGTDTNPDDKTIMVILIAVGAGIVGSRWASSFAGLGATTMIVEMGWLMGHVSDGVAIVAVFIALFIGLNVAGNVNYDVRRE